MTLLGWTDTMKALTMAGLWTIGALLVWAFALYFASNVFKGIRKGWNEAKKVAWGVKR